MNTKMKVLSLALVGLCGYAGSAMAVCPTDPAQPTGAWSSKSVLGGALTVSTPGYETTECKLDASITSATFGSAYVRDDSPASEPHYRARFLVDTDALTGLNSLQSVRLLSANTETPYLSIGETVRVSVFGNLAGTAQSLAIAAGCEGATSNLCSTNVPLTGTSPHVVQIEWIKGTTGTINIWVDNGVEGTPTATIAGNTNGWVVDYAVLGLSTSSPGYRASQLNKVVSFDQFDSRRTTFIPSP